MQPSRSFALALLAAVLSLTGCTDKDAINFARKTRDMLDGYRKQLEGQVDEAQKTYLAYSTLRADSDAKRLGHDRAALRDDFADKLALAYVENAKKPSHFREDLAAFAAKEHAANLASHDGALDRSRAYLERIEQLRIEKDKIEAFAKLLDAMTVDRPLQRDAEEIGDFVDATKGEFDKLVCADLASQIQQLNKPTATAAEKSRVAMLRDLSAKRGCAH
ncbi:MAG: hypothetical protein U0Q16_09630 [Bryobacteraceae bacterium]